VRMREMKNALILLLENMKRPSGRHRRRWELKEPGQLSNIALGYGLDYRGFDSRQGLGSFLFTTVSRPALGPTLPPIQWVLGASPWG
jgi:hypothetical protein